MGKTLAADCFSGCLSKPQQLSELLGATTVGLLRQSIEVGGQGLGRRQEAVELAVCRGGFVRDRGYGDKSSHRALLMQHGDQLQQLGLEKPRDDPAVDHIKRPDAAAARATYDISIDYLDLLPVHID